MAGDWIKMRVDLHTDPKVMRIACAVCAHGVRGKMSKSAQRCAVVGALHLVWCLFDTHSVDGQLEGYTPEVVDEFVGISGFAAAMASVGWIDSTPKGLTMHNFKRHNGQSAKRRDMHSANVAAKRACASQAHIERTDSAPEKRREEERRSLENGERAASGDPPAKTKPKPVGITAEAFVQLWRDRGHQDAQLLAAAGDFHAHRAAMRKPISAIGGAKLVAVCEGFTPAEVIADITRAIASGYQGLRPTRIVTPAAKKTDREAEINAQIARVKAKMGLTA